MRVRVNVSALVRVDGTAIRNHVLWFDGASKFGACFLLLNRTSNCGIFNINIGSFSWLSPPLEPRNGIIFQTAFDRSVNGLFYTSLSGFGSQFDASLNLYNFEAGESAKITQIAGPPAQPLSVAYGSASHLLCVLKIQSLDSKTIDLAAFSAYSGAVISRGKGFSPLYTAQQFAVRPMIDDGARDQSSTLFTIVADNAGQYQLYQLANVRSGSFIFQNWFALGQNTTHYTVLAASVKSAKRHLFVTYVNVFGNLLVAYDLDQRREIQRIPNLPEAAFALEEY